MVHDLRGSRSEEDSRSLFKLLGLRQLKVLAIGEVVGYSLKRVLLVGLFFPAVVSSAAFGALAVSLFFQLPIALAFVFVFASTMSGFALGTFMLIRLTDKILAFARKRS